MPIHCVVNILSLGLGPASTPFSLSATKFTINSGTYNPSFSCLIEPRSCIQRGLVAEIDQMTWWLQQPDSEQKQELLKALTGGIQLQDALENFQIWWRSAPIPSYIWSLGSSFDPPLITNCFKSFGVAPPFSQHRIRDIRTLFALAYPSLEARPPLPLPENAGTQATAEAQAQAIINAYAKLKIIETGTAEIEEPRLPATAPNFADNEVNDAEDFVFTARDEEDRLFAEYKSDAPVDAPKQDN